MVVNINKQGRRIDIKGRRITPQDASIVYEILARIAEGNNGGDADADEQPRRMASETN